jgi:two-component system response regulator MprA
MRVLIAEDERRMAETLRKGLESEGYAVLLAHDGLQALELAQAADFELFVLDVMLPGLDGFTVARRLREAAVKTPILMLTARDNTQDIVRGLDCGADDYLTKPFSFEVLLARLRALCRRAPVPQSPVLQCADLALDPATRVVTRSGRRIDLSKTEFGLLELLLRRAPRVVGRGTLIDAVWGYEKEIETNTLDAFIRLLRRKVEAPSEAKLIHTMKGVGFCLREDRLE